MRYVAIFLGSFVLVFAGTYLYVTRIEYPRKYGGSSSPADSVKAAVDTGSTDTVKVKITKKKATAPEEKTSTALASPTDTVPIYRPNVPEKKPNVPEKKEEETPKPRVSFFKLARLYSVMRPQDAASALSKLNDDVVVEILSKMEERKAAKILAAMGPDRAADLTAKMLVVKRKGI